MTTAIPPHPALSGETTVCSRCVCDTTIPGIEFDADGVCNFCHIFDELDRSFPRNDQARVELEAITADIKRAGRHREYDCIIGVSGGRDSTYTLHLAHELGLRPLAVHFDNGWNSEIAVTNIHNATRRLDIDLYTHVADYEEFKDLQKAFLRASVPDADIPTDVAIFGTLHQAAVREGVRYIINGHSFRTEGLMPIGWTYMDGRYIRSVHRRFGTKRKLKTVPNFTLADYAYYALLRRIRTVPILNYVEYDHDHVNRLLEDTLGWTYYGGHHHESYYTHFFQSYYLPKKFNIDKRKIESSALVRSGKLKRADALEETGGVDYPYDEELVEYAVKKLGLTTAEFDEIMAAPNRTFHDHRTYYPLLSRLEGPLRLGVRMGLVPRLLALKFLS